MYGTLRTLYAHKGHCEHVKCVFMDMYFKSCETTQMFKFSMSQFIFRVRQDICLDNLNSRCFRLILWHSPHNWSRKWFPCVFFIHPNPHWWPVWTQACNLPKPAQRQIGFGFNLVSTILAIVLFASLSWFLSRLPACLCGSTCVYFTAVPHPNGAVWACLF